MFDPAQIHPLPDFSWQAVQANQGIESYRHFYRLDKLLEIEGVYHCFGNVYSEHYALLAQAFIHPDNQKNIFLIHGYTDHLGLYDRLIGHLLKSGFNVVGLDLPGHGLSLSGIRAGIESFSAYQEAVTPFIEQATQTLSGSWFLLGQSTGGTIAMDYILHNPKHPFAKQILLAPLVIPAHWPLIKLQLFAARRFLKSVPRKFNRNSGDEKFLRFVRLKDPLQPKWLKTSWVQSLYDWQEHFEHSPSSVLPTLLIQGDKDTVVDWQYNREKVKEKFSQTTELIIPGANHHLANESDQLRKQVFSQIIGYLERA